MTFDPAGKIQDFLAFGEFGGVNPAITDSSTFTFKDPHTMEEIFDHDIEGCFLYSRHWNPTNKALAQALAGMETTASAQITASGMGAIASTILQLCGSGDEIISSRTIYGGTYAFLKNFIDKLGIKTHFVDMGDATQIQQVLNSRTKLMYCESLSNPLLEVANLPMLSQLAREYGLKLVVDNTFSPMLLTPALWGAHIVIHSLTKFINGTSDCVAGVICSDKAFIQALSNVNSGACMLLGPVLDSLRSASILKNMHTLHIRMQKHGENALFLAQKFRDYGIKTFYPGLPEHPQHQLLKKMKNTGYGYGGMLVIDAGTEEQANQLMVEMQQHNVGYLAVSLGYFKTLFSAPGHSTSSEIPAQERETMGLSNGLIRLSIGLDNDIERTWERIEACLAAL